jgi:putative transposase
MFVYSDVGKKYPERRHLPHVAPSWAGAGSLYFITVCCRQRKTNQLCHPGIASSIFEATRYRHISGAWFVRLLLLMPDHLHALVAIPSHRPMSTVIQQWKGRIARETGICWQRGFFEHRLRNSESWEEKAHYIRRNPIRAGLIGENEKWIYVWQPD